MLVYCIQCRPRSFDSTFIKFNSDPARFFFWIPTTNIQVTIFESKKHDQGKIGLVVGEYVPNHTNWIFREELSDEIFENKVKTRKFFSRRPTVRMIIDVRAWTGSCVREGGRVSWGPYVVVGVLLVNRQWEPTGSGHMGTLSPCRQTDRQTGLED